MKPVEAANKEVAKALLNDLEDIQWTAINETFFDQIELVEKKYLKNNLLDVNTVSALRDFFKYFKDIWVHSGENKWYEGSALYRPSPDVSLVLNDPDLGDPVLEADYAAPASLLPSSMSP